MKILKHLVTASAIARQIVKASLISASGALFSGFWNSKAQDSAFEYAPQFVSDAQSARTITELRCDKGGPVLTVEDVVISEGARRRRFQFQFSSTDHLEIESALSDVFDASAEVFLSRCVHFQGGFLLQMLRVPNLAAVSDGRVIMTIDDVASSLVLVELRVRNNGDFVISQVGVIGTGDRTINRGQETVFWPLPYGMPEGRDEISNKQVQPDPDDKSFPQ